MGKGALDRGIEILFLLSSETQGLDVDRIASRVGVPASSVYRILRTLRKRDLVTTGSTDGTYRLGLAVLQFANSVEQRLDMARLAAPNIQKLAAETGETVLATMLDGARAVTADVAVPSEPVRVSAARGRVIPLHAGASSKVMLAYLPEGVWRDLIGTGPLVALTRKTITNPRRLWAECRTIRARGYALSDEEVFEGTRAVAAPMFDSRGRVCGSLSIVGPRHRLQGARLRRATALVKHEALQVSQGLGFRLGADPVLANSATSRTPAARAPRSRSGRS